METIASELKCKCCKIAYNESDKFCGTCGYPLQGTIEEQKLFSRQYNLTQFEKDIVHKRIAEARVLLFIIALFTLIQGFVQYFKDSSAAVLIINLMFVGIYAGLGFWANKKAFAAILTGGLLYVAVIILNAFLEPLSIFHGIIFKIIFIGGFIRATYGAYKYKIS